MYMLSQPIKKKRKERKKREKKEAIIQQSAKTRNIYISCKIMENVCSASTAKEFCGSDPAKNSYLVLQTHRCPVKHTGSPGLQ